MTNGDPFGDTFIYLTNDNGKYRNAWGRKFLAAATKPIDVVCNTTPNMADFEG